MLHDAHVNRKGLQAFLLQRHATGNETLLNLAEVHAKRVKKTQNTKWVSTPKKTHQTPRHLVTHSMIALVPRAAIFGGGDVRESLSTCRSFRDVMAHSSCGT